MRIPQLRLAVQRHRVQSIDEKSSRINSFFQNCNRDRPRHYDLAGRRHNNKKTLGYREKSPASQQKPRNSNRRKATRNNDESGTGGRAITEGMSRDYRRNAAKSPLSLHREIVACETLYKPRVTRAIPTLIEFPRSTTYLCTTFYYDLLSIFHV